MTGLFATLEIYRLAVTRAAALALRNWAVLASAFVYGFISSATGWFAPALGLLGGFVVVLVQSACIASFLYLVEMMVRTSRVTLADFQRSFGVYLWDVIGVRFVLWLFFGFAGPLLVTLPEGGLVLKFVTLLFVVFFNAVPELIYLGHHSTVALLSESYRFIVDNWLEWFPPNLLMLGILLLLVEVPTGSAAMVVQVLAIPLFVYFAMVLRGLLFLELSGTSRRGRIFRYRMGR